MEYGGFQGWFRVRGRHFLAAEEVLLDFPEPCSGEEARWQAYNMVICSSLDGATLELETAKGEWKEVDRWPFSF